MKGQTEVVTMVLIGGIVISMMGAAYLWGMPLLQKRVDISDVQNAGKFFNALDQKIVNLARTCTISKGCSDSIDISVKGLFRVVPYGDASTDSNSVLFDAVTSGGMFASGEWITLNTPVVDAVAAYGNEAGVVFVRSQRESSGYKLTFKLWYRELDTATKGYKINLQSDMPNSASSGKIVLTYMGSQVNPGGRKAGNGGNLEVTNIKISFE